MCLAYKHVINVHSLFGSHVDCIALYRPGVDIIHRVSNVWFGSVMSEISITVVSLLV